MSAGLAELLARVPWRSYFGQATLQRAQRYLEQGRIADLQSHARGSGWQITGRVRGSEPAPYLSEVQLQSSAERGLRMTTRCSCPVQGFCKHTAALVLAAAAPAGPQEEDPMRPWDDWLQRLEAAEQRPIALLPEEQRFVLLLRGDRERLPRLHVQPAWLRTLKNGKFAAPRAIEWSLAGPAPAPPRGWEPQMYDDLCALSSGQNPYFGGGQGARIEFPHQERLLEGLLARYPAYWEKPAAQALTPGPEREIDVVWRDQPDGSQRLAAQVEDAPGAQPLRAHGLWYVDPARSQIGRLKGDRQLLEALPTAPAAQPAQLPRLRDRLAQHPRLDRLTAPADRGEVERIEAGPRALLRLRILRYRQWQGPQRSAGCAQLLFDYGPLRLAAGGAPRERRLVDGRVLEVQRDRSAEHAAREALEQLHLLDAALVSAGIRTTPALADGDYVLERQRGELATPDHWLPLLPRLAAAGFALEFDEAFPLRLLPEPQEWRLDVAEQAGNWFDLSLGIVIDGERVELLPILRRALADPSFPLRPAPNEPEGAVWLAPLDEVRRVPLPLARLRTLIEPLLEWLESAATGTGDHLRLRRAQLASIEDLDVRAGLLQAGGASYRDQLARLRQRPPAVDAPPGFAAQLRPYQREGLAWLGFLAEAGLGGVLADDMGLGKTVQVLAHLLAEKQAGRLGGESGAALVICPTSLVGNWRAEAERFAPQLRVLVLHGPTREAAFAQIAHSDLVVTTYPLLPRDREALTARPYALLVLDEAQQIKNARTQAAQVVRELQASRRLAMTGTPLENHLGELWAQFDAVEPGLLGDEKAFTRHFRTPIEKQGDTTARDRLNRRIAPLMLRRRKQDVLADLPAKTEILRSVELDGRQRELYETLRLAQQLRVQEAVAERGLAQSGIVVLDALLKLRQVCCDPRLVKLEAARRAPHSAKLELLLEMLDKLVDEQRRVLVFSQFTEMLDLIAAALAARGIEHLMLTGQTTRRAELVKRFQQGQVPVFLISLKAGGVGLNLTAADTVIHYDPWWNPAAEAQATDRAHRIGQDKPVFVYRLICAGTVEEKIQALQARKAELARAVLEGGVTTSLRFDEADLEALFAPPPQRR